MFLSNGSISKPGEVTAAVKTAIDCGYRHLDCARAYQNEDEVGAGIKAKVDDGTIKREDLFVTSKLWCTHHHPDDVERACKQTLDSLGLEYLDLFLIHWPMAYKRGDVLFPKDADGNWQFDDTPQVETWKAMEKLVEKGLCKDIGLSNSNKKQVQDILDACKIKPATLQIELHPLLIQEDMVQFCKENGVTVTAYSPLGSPDRPWIKDDDPRLMEDPTVVEIAKKKGKSPAQILIRFALDRGNICIPKSVTPSRIQANFETLNFKLTSQEMEQLKGLNKDYRGCALEWIAHPHHPFFPI
ncbi:hypothetical protein BSL78_06502 [Apostichopus japonicus]|uniref:NADP-dependent oxidoreductase domain-containing protein n=1 Tax=Stichopus japonicus TaxID=307972 RepID=A0A2G8L8K6_STIJA|nr:hypothetical protein BSL78_06502 [Apostichopus japonicus]